MAQQTEAQKMPLAQSLPPAEADRSRARQRAALGRTPEVPPKQTDEGFRDTAARKSVAPRFAATVPEGRVEWRFYAGGRIERYDERLLTSDAAASPVKEELLAASAPSEKICWAVGGRGVIIRVVLGSPWKVVGSPTEEDLVSIEARDDQNATVRTAGGKIYTTTDGGKTWRSQPAR